GVQKQEEKERRVCLVFRYQDYLMETEKKKANDKRKKQSDTHKDAGSMQYDRRKLPTEPIQCSVQKAEPGIPAEERDVKEEGYFHYCVDLNDSMEALMIALRNMLLLRSLEGKGWPELDVSPNLRDKKSVDEL